MCAGFFLLLDRWIIDCVADVPDKHSTQRSILQHDTYLIWTESIIKNVKKPRYVNITRIVGISRHGSFRYSLYKIQFRSGAGRAHVLPPFLPAIPHIPANHAEYRLILYPEQERPIIQLDRLSVLWRSHSVEY